MASIKLFKIRGIRISIDYSWFFIFLLVFWSLSAGYLPRNFPGYSFSLYLTVGLIATFFFFVSILIHELMHSFVAISSGINIPEITFFIFGGVSRLSHEAKTPQTELKIAIAGPLSSFVLSVIFWALKAATAQTGIPLATALFGYLSWINLALGIFNLVPAFPLDGGRVFRAILWMKTNSLAKATKVASDMGKGFAIVLMILGGIEIFSGALIGGLWLLFIGMFLRGIAAAGYQELIIRQSLESVDVREIMVKDIISVPEGLTLSALISEYFLKYHYRGFPVENNGKVLGIITLSDISHISRETQDTQTVENVMTPISPQVTIQPRDSLAEALKRMLSDGLNRLLVIENNKMIGMITKGSLIRFLELKSVLSQR